MASRFHLPLKWSLWALWLCALAGCEDPEVDRLNEMLVEMAEVAEQNRGDCAEADVAVQTFLREHQDELEELERHLPEARSTPTQERALEQAFARIESVGCPRVTHRVGALLYGLAE